MAERDEKEREDETSQPDPLKRKPEVDDKDIDEALEETFPASDPPAY